MGLIDTIISVANNSNYNRDEKTLKAFHNRWGSEGFCILNNNSQLKSYFRDNSIIFFWETSIAKKEYDLDVEPEKTFLAEEKRKRLFALSSLRDLSSNRREPGWLLSDYYKKVE